MSEDAAEAAAQRPLHFDAVLHPHRSLSPRGFAVLMLLLAGISFAAGMAFVLHGAWPVLGFFGLDVLAVYVAFRLNYRSGRLFETLQLSDDTLLLCRVSPGGGERRWRFPAYWVQVLAEEGRGGALRLRSHGRDVRFAQFLTEEEREQLAEALRQALLRARAQPAL